MDDRNETEYIDFSQIFEECDIDNCMGESPPSLASNLIEKRDLVLMSESINYITLSGSQPINTNDFDLSSNKSMDFVAGSLNSRPIQTTLPLTSSTISQNTLSSTPNLLFEPKLQFQCPNVNENIASSSSSCFDPTGQGHSVGCPIFDSLCQCSTKSQSGLAFMSNNLVVSSDTSASISRVVSNNSIESQSDAMGSLLAHSSSVPGLMPGLNTIGSLGTSFVDYGTQCMPTTDSTSLKLISSYPQSQNSLISSTDSTNICTDNKNKKLKKRKTPKTPAYTYTGIAVLEEIIQKLKEENSKLKENIFNLEKEIRTYKQKCLQLRIIF